MVPTEASNLWFDNMRSFPKQSKKQDAALYQLYVETRKCSQNAEYNEATSTPNLPAGTAPRGEKRDKAFYPDAETMKHLEVSEKFDHKWTGKYQ